MTDAAELVKLADCDIAAKLAKLKDEIEQFDLMPWTVEGWSERNAPRIATAPDAHGHRHTVCKFPRNFNSGRATVLVEAVSIIPAALAEIERLRAALAAQKDGAREAISFAVRHLCGPHGDAEKDEVSELVEKTWQEYRSRYEQGSRRTDTEQ